MIDVRQGDCIEQLIELPEEHFPFGGKGTTGKVAMEHGRHATLIELNRDYIPLIEEELQTTPGLALA